MIPKKYPLCMPTRNLHLKMSEELLEKISLAAKANYISRSDFIRQSVAEKLNKNENSSQNNSDDYWEKLIDGSDNSISV